MRCHICDRSLENPQYSRDHQEWDPCGTCQKEINELLEDFMDNPFEIEVHEYYNDETYYNIEETSEGDNGND